MNIIITMIWIGALGGRSVVAAPPQGYPAETTQMARKLVLNRIDEIAQNGHCRQTFGQEKIDLNLLRFTVRQTRFYDVTGREGDLKFSAVVGKLASPDRTLRVLALQVEADAFVLGYYDANRYVRTRRVVLTRGYHEQMDPSDGGLRLTTMEEKQNLLLHEILHIALGKDDDDLNSRALCPLRLLAFCPRSRAVSHRPGSPASRERVWQDVRLRNGVGDGDYSRQDGVRPGKSNVLRSGPIVAFSEGLRTKAGRRRNATRAFVLIPNDSMRERLAYLCSPSSPRGMGRSSPTQAAVR